MRKDNYLQQKASGDMDVDHGEIENDLGFAGIPFANPFVSTQTVHDWAEYFKVQTQEAMFQCEYWSKKLDFCRMMEKRYCLSESKNPQPVRAVNVEEAKPSIFLKPPLNDNVIIDAMQDASSQLLGVNHQKKVKNITWKDCHVLICLVYYVNLIDYEVFPDFNNQLKLHTFCSNSGCFPTLLTERQYSGLYNQLNALDFDKYISNERPELGDKPIGKATLKQWKGFYVDASSIFEHYIYI